jgi:predicted ester cyclase
MKRRALTLLGAGSLLAWVGIQSGVVQAKRASSTEANKAMVRRFVDEVMNQGKVDVIDELVATDYVEHQTPPGAPATRDGLKQMMTSLHQAFPDLHVTLDDTISEGDKVVMRTTTHGTQKGEFMGIAPTNKEMTMTGIDIVRFQGGKAVEHWGNEDDLGMMQQLGAIPAAPAAAQEAPAAPDNK